MNVAQLKFTDKLNCIKIRFIRRDGGIIGYQEVRSAKGRADAVVKTKDRIYVFEFKLEGTVDEALKQIDEKGYLLPYRTDGRELVKVGVSFNAEERNIGEYKVV